MQMRISLRTEWWLLLSLVFVLISICSTTTSAPLSDDRISCRFDISIEEGIVLNVDAYIDVESITLSAIAVTYSQEDILSISTSSPEVMGAIKYALKGMISEQIHQTFPACTIQPLQDLPSFTNQQFTDHYKIILTNTFFNLSSEANVYDMVNGFLDMSGVIDYSVHLHASAGWNNTYRFILPQSMSYQQVTNASFQNNMIIWDIHNPDGGNPVEPAEMYLKYSSPTTPPIENSEIEVLFELDCRDSKSIKLATIYKVLALNIESYGIIPDFISNIQILPADGIRLCIENNFTNWDFIYNKSIIPLNNQIKQIIESSEFNQSLHQDFSWNTSTTSAPIEPFNLSNMDSFPPVSAIFSTNDVHVKIFNISSRAVFGLINAGAVGNMSNTHINFGGNLSSIPYPYQGTLVLPEHILLNETTRYQWNATKGFNGTFTSENAQSYRQQDIEHIFDINVKQTDLNLLSFFTGKTEMTVNVDISEEQKRNITVLPPSCTIPSELTLQYFNADAFRICVEEQVFSNESIDEFLTSQKMLFESRILNLYPPFNGNAKTDRDAFAASLHWDGNISSMDATDPFSVVSKMYSSYPLSFSFSFLPPSLTVSPQNMSFSAIKNAKATYTMLFPKGLVIGVNDSLNRAEVEKLSNGQYLVTLSFNESEEGMIDYVVLTLQPTGLYIIGLFMPCIISVIITIILLFVVYIVRKKRNGFRMHRHHPPSEHDSAYENEDYYVPPPPSARK